MRARRAVKRHGAFALTVLFVVATVRLARGEVVSLQTLEQRALAHRAALAWARAGTASARAGVALARAKSGPRVGLGLDGNVSPGGELVEIRDIAGNRYLVQGSRALGQADAFRPQLRYGATVSVDKPLIDFGRGKALENAAVAEVSAATAGEHAERARVLREVRRAYLALIAAFSGHALVQKDVEAARARRRLLEAAVVDGLEPPRNLASIRYEESLVEMDASRARADLEGARIDLARTTGRPLPASAEPDLTWLDARVPSRERAIGSPDLDTLEKQAAAALAATRAAEADRLPVLDVGADAGVQGQNTRLFPSYRAEVSLSLPLWDGGISAARAARARAEATGLEARAREYRSALDLERARARADFENATERLSLAVNLAQHARARVQAAEERERLGEIAVELVVQARADLRRAEYEVVLSKVRRMDAVLRLADPGASMGSMGSP